MLSDLQSLQNGTLSPTSFMRSVVYKRVTNLELSSSGYLHHIHTKTVNCLDIDRVEDKYLLCGCNNGTLNICELYSKTNELSYGLDIIYSNSTRSLNHGRIGNGHTQSVDTVQWYPFDTGMFTTSSMDHQLKVWNSRQFKVVDTIFMPDKIFEHHMSTIATHHSIVAVAGNFPQAILVDMRTGSKCQQLRGHDAKITSIRWSPFSDQLLATGGADNRLLLWDIRSAKGFLKALDQHNGEALTSSKDLICAHRGMINSLCFSTDGLYLLSFGTDNQLRLWDVALGKNTFVNYGRIVNESHRRLQIDLCYDAAAPVVFVPSQSKILVYDMFTGLLLNTLIGHLGPIKCCAFRNQYHELYSGAKDHHILIWSPDEGRDKETSTDSSLHDVWSDDDD